MKIKKQIKEKLKDGTITKLTIQFEVTSVKDTNEILSVYAMGSRQFYREIARKLINSL